MSTMGSIVKACVTQDFVFFTVNMKLHGIGSKDNATLVANHLCFSRNTCQTHDEIVLSSEGDVGDYDRPTIISFKTKTLLETKEEIQPTVLKAGLSTQTITCTASGTVYYVDDDSFNIYEITK